MRIISGKYKGKQIQAPKNLPVRPTTDFAKEGLFNILRNQFNFQTVKVLDLFSGTGNISFEFASKDAAGIIAVDNNFKCCRFIRDTAEKLGFDQLRVIKMDAFRFLESCGQAFDIIFADPPYDMKQTGSIPGIVFEKQLLKPGGWLIIEHSKHTELEKTEHFLEKRSYGNVNFSIFSG